MQIMGIETFTEPSANSVKDTTHSREGAKVFIADINAEGGEETTQNISDSGGEAYFVKTDISQSIEIEALNNNMVERYDRLDCAFNNAAILGEIVSVVDHTEETWDHVLDTNLKRTWLCMKYQIPQILKQGGGAVVNTTATTGLQVVHVVLTQRAKPA